jgi:hypothetical protein
MMKAPKTVTLKKHDILVLRNCNADMTSHNGFKWPKRGPVRCRDWKSDFRCGNGLHGLPWGIGSTNYFYSGEDIVWLVVRVDSRKMQHGEGNMIDKCKFPEGHVVYSGSRDAAVALIQRVGGKAAERCVYGQSTSGYSGQSTSGNYGQSTSRNYGQSTSGYSGQSTSGSYGQSTSGNSGHSYALHNSKAKAGKGGVIVLSQWVNNRWECRVAHVGRKGIKPDTWYKLNEKLEFVKAT